MHSEAPLIDPDGYRPGQCNIGTAEIARRRRAGHTGALATLGTLAVLGALRSPAPMRLIAIAPATLAASGYLQAHLRFCAGYGFRALVGFDEVGATQEVEDAEARRRDRARAVQIGLASLGIGAAVGIGAALAP
jgi:hypothetical protein